MPVCPSCGHAFGTSKGALTRRQRDVLEYILVTLATERYAPTLKEIAGHLQFRSLATVHEHLQNLVRKGYIRREFNQDRGITAVAS